MAAVVGIISVASAYMRIVQTNPNKSSTVWAVNSHAVVLKSCTYIKRWCTSVI